MGGVESLYKRGLSSTSSKDFFHGLLCPAMRKDEINQTVQQFAEWARRARGKPDWTAWNYTAPTAI